MKRLSLSGLAIAAILATPMADARELRTAPGTPPAHPAGGVLYMNLQKYLADDPGDLTSIIVGPEIATVGNMKDALQSQLVDVGNLLPLFVPADLPHVAFAGELALTGTNPQAMGAAMTEYVVNCAECQAELKATLQPRSSLRLLKTRCVRR